MSNSDTYDILLKLILIGDSGVGKSCFVTRYCDNMYDDTYISTIGVDFKIKTLTYKSKTVKLQIWDTAGQERFKTITTSYYRGSHGIALFFDLTNYETFIDVGIWLEEIKRFANENTQILLIGTKADLVNKKVVKNDEIMNFANSHNLTYIETSSKNNLNIDNSIFEIINKIMPFINKNFNSVRTFTIPSIEKI